MIGPTGKFPRGKLSKHDEGEIALSVGADHKQATVVINFGSPVVWVGLPKKEALGLAQLIIKHAESLGDA